MQEVENGGDARSGILQTPRPHKRKSARHVARYLDAWTVMSSLPAALCERKQENLKVIRWIGVSWNTVKLQMTIKFHWAAVFDAENQRVMKRVAT